MTTVRMHGFTIIELMLFLAVSAGLFAALLLGVNNGITQQRYKDSVYAYSSFLQSQYTEVLNTRNNRSSDWRCSDDPGGPAVTSSTTGSQPRGTSSCVILGRAIEVKNDVNEKTTIISSLVIGSKPTTLSEPTNDIAALRSYNPTKVNNSEFINEVDLEWDSRLTKTTDSSDPTSTEVAGFLILRSPLSGLLKIFASNRALPSDLKVLMDTQSASTDSVVSCVKNLNKGLIPTHSVTLNPQIASPSGVTVREDGSRC
jgi:type II secretory pathway pseudopilin PulG